MQKLIYKDTQNNATHIKSKNFHKPKFNYISLTINLG